MQAGDNWCPACGQKAYNGPIGFWQLMSHLFEAIFNVDNRLFRTLAALAVPGRLTNNFLAGKQKPYFHPLRLFFFSGVLMVATYSFYTAQEVGDSLEIELESKRAQAYKHRFGEDLRVGLDSIKESFSAPSVAIASDSLLRLLGHSSVAEKSTFYISYPEYKGGLTFENRRILLSTDDYQILSPSELVSEYKVEGTFNQYLFKQATRINRLNISSVTTMMSQIIWGLLLLVPLAAAMLKLFYLRRKRRYVEHFIFTLHTHAFIFITQIFAALGLLLFESPALLIASAFVTIIYFLLALKRVYRQSWIKTIVKAAMMGWGYFFLFTLALSFSVLLAVILF